MHMTNTPCPLKEAKHIYEPLASTDVVATAGADVDTGMAAADRELAGTSSGSNLRFLTNIRSTNSSVMFCNSAKRFIAFSNCATVSDWTKIIPASTPNIF